MQALLHLIGGNTSETGGQKFEPVWAAPWYLNRAGQGRAGQGQAVVQLPFALQASRGPGVPFWGAPGWPGLLQGETRRTCSGTGPDVGADAGRHIGSLCAIEVEGLKRLPPTVGGRPMP